MQWVLKLWVLKTLRCYSIPPSSVVRQHFQSFSPMKKTGPIKLKFHMKTGTKFCSNGPGHMTKMAATPIYGERPLKSSPEP